MGTGLHQVLATHLHPIPTLFQQGGRGADFTVTTTIQQDGQLRLPAADRSLKMVTNFSLV
jgi:hypothetical protein